MNSPARLKLQHPKSKKMADFNEDEWEACTDGVLTYRRKKCRISDSQPPLPPATTEEETVQDAVTVEKTRISNRKRVLLKLKDKYLKELDRWSILSNSLSALEQRHVQHRDEDGGGGSEDVEDRDLLNAVDSTSGSCLGNNSVLDEIFTKVETEEAILNDMSKLCDISESLLDTLEQESNNSLFDLPIWSSPRTLMVALYDNLEES